MAPPGDLQLLRGRALGFLLEPVQEDNPPAREEKVDDSEYVRLTLLAQLPEIPIQVAHQRCAGSDIADPELLHGPAETGTGFEIEPVEELLNGTGTARLQVKLRDPFALGHYEYFRMSDIACKDVKVRHSHVPSSRDLLI